MGEVESGREGEGWLGHDLGDWGVATGDLSRT